MGKILLVGADPGTVFLYRVFLERAGLGLASSKLVEPLDDLVRLGKPAALLLDVGGAQPADAEALARGIRSQEEFQGLPVFTLTSQPLGEPATGAGADHPRTCFQNCPTAIPEVVKAVKDALKAVNASTFADSEAIGGCGSDQGSNKVDVDGGDTQLSRAEILIDDTSAHLFEIPLSELQSKLNGLAKQLSPREFSEGGSEPIAGGQRVQCDELSVTQGQTKPCEEKGLELTTDLEVNEQYKTHAAGPLECVRTGKAGEAEGLLIQKQGQCERLPAESSDLHKTGQTLEDRDDLDQMRQLGERELAQKQRENACRTSAEEVLGAALERQSALELELNQATRAPGRAVQEATKFASEAEGLEAQHQTTRKEKEIPRSRVDESHRLETENKAFLEQKLDLMAAFDALTTELDKVRTQLVEERSQRQRAEAAIVDLQASEQELTNRLAAVSRSDLAHQQNAQMLELELEDAKSKLSTSESALQCQLREFRRLEVKCKGLEENIRDLATQLSSQTVIDEARRRREAELKSHLLAQQTEIERSSTALGTHRAAIERVKNTIQANLQALLQELQIEPRLEEQNDILLEEDKNALGRQGA
jgi:hypothetical protein